MSSNSNLGTDSDVEKMARQARKAGWTVEINRRNHIVWRSPPSAEHADGERFVSPLTFKDKNRIKKIRKFLSQRGVAV